MRQISLEGTRRHSDYAQGQVCLQAHKYTGGSQEFISVVNVVSLDIRHPVI